MKPTDQKDAKRRCPCKRKQCARFGDCKACRAHHLEKGDPPYCERPAGRRKKRTVNRGVSHAEEGRDE